MQKTTTGRWYLWSLKMWYRPEIALRFLIDCVIQNPGLTRKHADRIAIGSLQMGVLIIFGLSDLILLSCGLDFSSPPVYLVSAFGLIIFYLLKIVYDMIKDHPDDNFCIGWCTFMVLAISKIRETADRDLRIP